MEKRRSPNGLAPNGLAYYGAPEISGAQGRVVRATDLERQRDFMADMHELFDDLAEYRARVIAARLSRSGDTIYNSSHRHAAVLIEQLFLDAENDVRIICRQLCGRSFGSPLAIAAAERFLERGGTSLNVIVDAPEVDADGRNAFLDRFEGRAGVSISKGGVMVPFDFMVVDQRAFRFESDAKTSVARANFNNPGFAKQLVDAFDVLTELRAA